MRFTRKLRRKWRRAVRPAPRPAARKPQGGEEQQAKRWWSVLAGKNTVSLLAWSLVFLLLLFASALAYLRPASPGEAVTLDEVFSHASQRRVQTASFLDHDDRVVGTAVLRAGAEPSKFWAAYPSSDAATNDLLRTFLGSGAKVSVNSQSAKSMVRFVAQFLLPLVLLANLFALLFSFGRGTEGTAAAELLKFGRIDDRRVANKERAETSFATVAGAGEAIAELAEVRDYLAEPNAFARMGATPPKGVLLVGPPGCGKTLLARAVAGEAKASFYSISGSEFVESLVGVGAARVRDLFRQARADAPAIIFIDELDAVGRQRGAGIGGGHDEREQTLNELLVQIDGFSSSEGVVVIAATNRPDILDSALLRAGRFDRHVTIDRPDVDERLAILRLHARARRLENPEADLPHIAKNTPGFTGADLANLLNEAALLAVRTKVPAISRQLLEEAVERVLAGPRRRAKVISGEEKRRIAYHEAGHVVVAAAMGKAEEVNKVSIIARGRGVGHLALLQQDKTVLTRRDMETQIAVAMGGIAAEELVLGEPSTGSEHDLERATATARDMAGRYGMSRLGRTRVLHEHGEVFLGRDYLATRDVSQPTLEQLDAEVGRILREEEEVARAVLSSHRDVLDELASALVAAETLQGPALDDLLRRVKLHVRGTDMAGNGKHRTVRARRSAATTPGGSTPGG